MFQNLLDPIILFFVLGLSAGIFKSDLRLPTQLYETLSVYLLLAIGLKGGIALANTNILKEIVPLSSPGKARSRVLLRRPTGESDRTAQPLREIRRRMRRNPKCLHDRSTRPRN